MHYILHFIFSLYNKKDKRMKSCNDSFTASGFFSYVLFNFSPLIPHKGWVALLCLRGIIMGIWKYAFLVFLGGCSYGVVSTFVKLAFGEGFNVSDVTGSQYFFGALMLWIISIFVPKNKLNWKQWLILLVSGIPMGATGIFYNQSLEYVDASFAIILLLQFTWIGIILQYILDKNKPTRKNIIATIIILVGSLLASGFLKSSITFSLVGIGWDYSQRYHSLLSSILVDVQLFPFTRLQKVLS